MKILIQSNNSNKDWENAIKDIQAYFLKANIDIEFIVEKSNYKNIPYVPINTSVGKALQIDPLWFKIRCDETKKRGFDGLIFATTDWKGLPMEALRSDVIPDFIDIQMGILEGTYDYNGIFINGDRQANVIKHELAHEFYIIQKRPDNTHYWYLQGKPEAIINDIRVSKGIWGWFGGIISLLNKPEPVAILKRKSDDRKQTLGNFALAGFGKSFECKTLELPWKDNQKNISCIPAGTYDCVLGYSPSFKKNLYEVKNVTNRIGIKIHSVNYVSGLKGCIGVGKSYSDINNDGTLDLTSSQDTLREMMAITKGKPFKLVVISS